MKFMLMRKADERTEKGVMPSENLLQAMADYNERMRQAGVFVTGDGLKPSSEGYRIEFSEGQARLPQGVSTHLTFSGNCREALNFYADLMGGQVRAMLAYSGTPMAEQVPESFRDRICHAELALGAHTIMGADVMPECDLAPGGGGASGLWI